MSYEAWGDGDEFYGPELPEGWLDEDGAKELQDRIAELERERAEALLDAERAREERNREHVRLNAEWMAKCEELRKDVEMPNAYAIYKLLLQRGGIPARRTSPENICDVIEVDRAIRDMAKKEGA